MTPATLLETLAGRGVVLTAEAGALRYRAPAGAMTPELRRQIEAHKAALIEVLAHTEQAALFSQGGGKVESSGTQGDRPSKAAPESFVPDRGQLVHQDPHAARLVHGDFARVRARLAALEAELDAGAAKLVDLPRDKWPGDLVDELNAKARAAARLAAVAEYQTFDELEEATGKAYQAHCGNPSDPALLADYRRLDDAWAAVLGLPEVRL